MTGDIEAGEGGGAPAKSAKSGSGPSAYNALLLGIYLRTVFVGGIYGSFLASKETLEVFRHGDLGRTPENLKTDN